MADTKFTVIINTYPSEGREAQLKNCVESILHQTLQDFNILIIENFTDGSKIEWLKNTFEKDSGRIEIIIDPTKKLSHLFDIGWRQATTEFIAYIADDVVIEEDWLKSVKNNFESNSTIGVVTGPIISATYPEGEMHRLYYLSQKNLFTKILSWPYIYFALESKPFAPGKLFESGAYSMGAAKKDAKNNSWQEIDLATTSSMGIRRTVLEKVDGFDKRFNFNHADGDLFIRIKNAGYKIIFDPEVVANHFLRLGPSRNAYMIGKDTGTFYRKHVRPKTARGIIGMFLNITVLNVYWIYSSVAAKNTSQLKGISGFIEGIIKYDLAETK